MILTSSVLEDWPRQFRACLTTLLRSISYQPQAPFDPYRFPLFIELPLSDARQNTSGELRQDRLSGGLTLIGVNQMLPVTYCLGWRRQTDTHLR